MSRAKRMGQLVVIVGLEAGALAWLLSLGRHPWLRIRWSEFGTWLRATPTDDALASFVWLAALGCSIWMAGSTVLYLAARATHAPVVLRSVEWMTLPAIRRVTERALGTILVASTLAATPVRADPPPPVVVVVDADGTLLPPGVAEQMPDTPRKPTTSTETSPPPLPDFPRPLQIAVEHDLPAEMTVVAGDNLWTMCRRHLTGTLGRRPTNEEIAPYWRAVITNNQPHLISGDPDLIYAGEVIAMPPVG